MGKVCKICKTFISDHYVSILKINGRILVDIKDVVNAVGDYFANISNEVSPGRNQVVRE